MRWPLPDWLKTYRLRHLPEDTTAALAVSLVLVPQGLAYATLAGLPPQAGLYAALLPLIAYSLLGSSRALSVGPVAIIALMTASALDGIAIPGSAEYVTAAIALALLAGVMLLLFGLLRLGAMAQFLSHPVISGFISGAALSIAIGQLPPLLGIELEGDTALQLLGDLLTLSWGFVASPATTFPLPISLTATVGLGTLLLFWLTRRYLASCLTILGVSGTRASLISKLVPTAAVLGSALAVSLFDWEDRMAVVGALPAGLPALVWPTLDLPLLRTLALPALMISLVIFVESIAIAQSFALRQRTRIDSNAELRGLGAANIASAVCGGFPVAGGFTRTTVNVDGGARTPLASILAAFFVALILLFATGVFHTLPMAVLAATVMAAVIQLVDLKSLRYNWRYDRAEGMAQLGTLLGVLIAGVEVGIAIGITLSLATLIWRASRPHMAVIGRIPETEHFRNVERFQVEVRPDLLMLRIDENLFFGNAEAVEKRALHLLEKQPEARHLVLVLSSVSSIDATALEMLELLNEQLKERGQRLHLAEVKGPVLAQLETRDFPTRLSGQLHLSANAAFETLAG